MNNSKDLTAHGVVSGLIGAIIGLPTLMLSYMVPIFVGILLIGNIPWALPLWLLWLAPISLVVSVNSRLFKVATGGENQSESESGSQGGGAGKVVSRTEQLIYDILGAITLGFFIGATGLDIWAVYFSATLLVFKFILGVALSTQSFPPGGPNY